MPLDLSFPPGDHGEAGGAAMRQIVDPCAGLDDRDQERRNDERLNLGGGYAADQSGRRGLSLQHGLGDVIAVAGAALVGVSWAHAVAAMVKQAPAQDGG